MISYEAIQDALTAVLVLLVISAVITLAWLSTNVREQPLVAFVVFHSSHNNGEREQSQRANNMSEGNSQEQQEATPVRQTVGVDSNGDSEGKMKIKQTDSSGGGGGVSDSTSNSSTDNVKKNSGGDADLVQVEKVDHSVDGVTKKDADNTTSHSTTSQDSSEDVAPDSALNPDRADTSSGNGNNNPKETPDRDRDTLHETELRKRRLQQFISMGDTTTTTHLERLSEQLMATLPSAEVSEQAQSSTQERNKSSSGGQVEDVCSSEGSTKDTLPASPDAPLKEEVPVIEEERPPGSIKIRLKFLDETQKFVFAQLTEQVGSFKRQHFSIEMDANRRIRLIFNGQLLSQDTSTLAQYGLFDNCVVHCHVSQPQHNATASSTQSREAAAQDEEDAYVSRLLAPLLYGVLAVMWYLRYEYGHLFNAMSTLILLFLTALLLVSTYLLYVTHHLPDASTAATASTLTQPQAS